MNSIFGKVVRGVSLLGILLAPLAASAGWSAADLEWLKNAFSAGIAGKYQAQEYPWQFLDTSNCFVEDRTCSGTNPDSPYGYVNFGPRGLATTMGQTDALVLIMETPPPMRYFGVTPYIHTRYYPSLPGSPEQSGLVPVFESLGDTVNVTNIKTLGSSAPGQNVFMQLSVFIMTADKLSYAQARNQFLTLGIPEYAINQIALPLTAVPLKMANMPAADTLGVLLRIAYPDQPTQMQDYIERAPVKALLLKPNQARAVNALPTPISKTPGSGSAENQKLAAGRDALVETLKARYAKDYEITEVDIKLRQSINYICVQLAVNCGGDNPDALYATDLQAYTPETRQEKVLIVGVNHVATSKARYLSHAIVNSEHAAGVAAASDDFLKDSGLIQAGITNPNDPLYDTYRQLYAYTISYDCSNEPLCQTIPEPTDSNPAGVSFGAALNITSRFYVDPATGTRPSSDEVIEHRTFVLKKK